MTTTKNPFETESWKALCEDRDRYTDGHIILDYESFDKIRAVIEAAYGMGPSAWDGSLKEALNALEVLNGKIE